MKTRHLLLSAIFSVAAVFLANESLAQCAYNSSSWGNYSTPACYSGNPGSWTYSGWNNTPASVGPGQRIRFANFSGGRYMISTCGNGSWSGYDTQITVRRTNNAVLAYNDDSNASQCNIYSNGQRMWRNSTVDYTSNVNEYVNVMIDRYNCQPNAGGSSSVFVRFRQVHNLSLTGQSVCEGSNIYLPSYGSPDRTASSNIGSHNRGTWSGTGVNNGNQRWYAPSVSSNTNYTVTYVFGACNTSATFTSLAYPNSISSISGSSNPCVGQASTYTCTTSGNATSYEWDLPAGWSGSSTSTSISVTPSGTGSGTIRVRGVNSCGTGSWRSISVTAITTLGAPTFITGNNAPCTNVGYTYSINPVAGASSYSWSVPSGWTFTGGGLSINATPSGSAVAGNVSVTANNACGAGAAANFSATPQSIPAQPGAISGDNTPCVNTSGQVYSVAAVSGATSYNWSFPSGWVINSGSGTNSVTVTSSSTGGTISVTASNICGTGPARTMSVSMTDVIGPPGAIAGSTAPCEGATTSYSISPVSGATGYTWTVPGGWSMSGSGLTINVTNNGVPGTITVAADNDCGTGPTSSLAVDPILQPVQSASISGNTSPCVGASETYTCAAVAEATSYNWSLPGGWTGTSSTNSITVTVGASGGTISVTAQNSCSTGPAQTLAVTTQDVIGPPGAITGTSTPCENSPYIYSVPLVPGATSYQWTKPAGWVGSSTGAVISLTPGPGAASGNITVAAVNVCGAGPVSSLAVAPISTPATPSAISGNTAPCIGATEVYSVTNEPGMTYNWTLPSGWVGSSSSSSISVTVGSSSGTISVTAQNTCGFISASSSLATTVDNVPAQPTSLNGNSTPCTGQASVYSCPAVPNTTSYEWQLPAGWTGSSTTNSISVTPGTGSGTIQVRGVNGCGNGSWRTLSVTAIDVVGPAASISGSTTPCQGSVVTYSIAAITGASSYQWTLPAGWSGSSTGLSISATVGANAGNVTVAAVNSCGTGPAATLAVTPYTTPAQPSAITGDNSPCTNTSYTYSVTNIAGLTYNWTLPAGWTLDSGSGTNSVTVTTSSSGGTISVTASNPCFTGSASTMSVTMDDVIGPPGAISGNTAPCEGVSAGYSISPVSGATGYTWNVPAGWSISGSGLSVSITNNGVPGNVTVAADNECGTGPVSSLAVDPILQPVQPATISGNTVPCVGATETYTCTAVPEATSYNWTLPGGWTGTSTTNSISVTVGATGGTISVTAQNSCSTSPAQTLAVTTQDVIGPPGAITGNDSPCMGTAYTYSIGAVSGATSYQWTTPAGWTGTSTGTSITLTPGFGASAGNITVQAVNICGAGPSSDLAVTPITVPITPAAITGPDPACIGQVMTYSCTAVPTATSYDWTFPAGWSGPASTAAPTVNVTPSSTAGTISVAATNACGSSIAQTLAVSTSDIPVASFTAAPFGVTATFTDNSTFNPTSWAWTFGDGNTSTDQNPFHYYGTGGTFNVCLTATNSCGTSVTFCQNVVIPDYFDYIWTGAISTDWETGGNWSGGLVPFGDNVLIPDVTNDPVISPGQTGLVNNITMNSQATLTINGTGSLHVTGDWVWPGSHTVSGSVVWDGFVPQPQFITGNITFDDMTVENSLTIIPTYGPVMCKGGLTVDGGDLVTGGEFTIISNSTETGWINPLANGGTITGDVNVQRHISSAGFHYIGSPVNTPALATELSEFTPFGPDGAQIIASSNCSSDSVGSGSPYGSVFEFNESNSFPTSCSQWGWNIRSSGNMTNGRGYAVRSTGAMNMNIKGAINDGTVTYSGLGHSGGAYGGFHIVSNPYPSPIIWNSPAGFDAAMYMWQSGGQYGGTYQAYFPGTAVAMMQGFFIRSSGGTANYVINNSDRTTGNPTFWRGAEHYDNWIELKVSKDGVADKTVIAFVDGATENWDSDFDAAKIPGNSDRVNISTELGGESYSINSMSSIGDKEFILPIGLNCGDDQNGVFDFEFKVRTEESTIVYLVDRKTGNTVRVRNGGVVKLALDDMDDEQRFALHFNPSITITESNSDLQIFNDGSGVSILASDDLNGARVEMFDLMGRMIYQDQAYGTTHQIPNKELVTGTYIVKVSGAMNGIEKVVIR